MLNPFASDFQPTAYSTEPKKDPPTIVKKKPENKKTDVPKKKTDSKKLTAKAKKTNGTEQLESTKNDKKTNLQASSSAKKSTNNKRKAKAVLHTTTTESIFSQESPFIAIEAAIDPIHRLDQGTTSSVNNRRQSLVAEKKFEHGYERYIDWIDRSLSCYDTVTVVGMENAIVDVVSIVTILYDRKIAAHDEIETFTMNPGIERNDYQFWR